MKNKLVKMLGVVALTGVILIGVGAKTDREKLGYVGTGIGGISIGYAMVHYSLKKEWKRLDNKY